MKWLNIGNTRYSVSDKGTVKNRWTGKLLKTIKAGFNDNYLKVNLGASMRGKYVHRLVAIAFLPNPDNLLEVDHINGDHKDNRLENLEWVTRAENARRMHKLKKLKEK